MSNMADPKDLVKSRWAKWKLNFSGLTVRQKASKILSHIIVLFSIAMLVCVGLIILEYFSYDTTYGTMIKCEEVFNKKGDLKGYINEYIVAYEDEQMTLSSSQVVKKLYDNNEEVRLYIKEVKGGYKICETYKTNLPLLITTISVGVSLLGLCVTDILLLMDIKIKRKDRKLAINKKDYIKGVDPKIIEYVETNILPKYTLADNGHGISHIRYVIDRSFAFANTVEDINRDMVYVVATYHDIGHSVDPTHHEEESATIFMADETIKAFFDKEQIKLIKEAIQDHRASGKREPRSVYGKIVSSADRNTDIFSPLKRTYEYRLANYPDMPLEEMMVEARKHIIDKFGEFGYASEKMYFADPEYDKFLRDIRMLVDDEKLFNEMFVRVNNIKGTEYDKEEKSDN